MSATTRPNPIPAGYHTATPYLIVKGAAAAIEFYKAAFGATEIMRMPGPGGMVMHAEIKVGDSPIMLADEFPQMGAVAPADGSGTTAFGLCLYVPDVDSLFKQATDAGARVKKPLADQFYGDRSGTVIDPFGHVWTIATHVEDVSEAEMRKRMAAMGNPCSEAA